MFKQTLWRGFIVVFCILLSSCKNNTDSENETKTIYFPGSKIIKQTIEYSNGKKNGTLKEFYRNGNLKIKQYFVNDTVRDSTIVYHENGNPAYLQIIIDGKREGCWKKFNEKGMLYSEICFKDGVLHGASTTYTYNSGRVLSRLNYNDGRKDGKHEYFYNSGKPKSISYFRDGQPCLGTEEWYESGENINNDFKIFITEQNRVLLNNTLTYLIRLENLKDDDEVYQVYVKDTGRVVTSYSELKRKSDYFELELYVPKGGFIMEQVKIAAYRKTAMKNTFIKTALINASANNF